MLPKSYILGDAGYQLEELIGQYHFTPESVFNIDQRDEKLGKDIAAATLHKNFTLVEVVESIKS